MLRAVGGRPLPIACGNHTQDNETCTNPGPYQGKHHQGSTLVSRADQGHIILLFLHIEPFLWYPAALRMDEKPMCVHAIWCARDKRYEVLPFLYNEALCFSRKYNL